jgi:hypothetical protein
MIELFKESKSLRRTLHNLNAKYGLSSFATKGKGNKSVRDRFHFSIAGLHAWLTNPILRGHTAYNRAQQQRQHHKHLWDIRYDTHPNDRLITDSDYKQLDDIFNWNKTHHGFNNESKIIHPLSGLVYCGECGRSHRIIGSLQRDKVTKFYYYQCQNYGVRACGQKTTIRDTKTEAAAIATLTSAAEQIATLAEVPAELVEPTELRELRAQLATLETMGANPAIATAINQMKSQIKNIEYGISSSGKVDIELRSVLVETFSNPLYFSTLADGDKKTVYRALIDRIIIKDGAVVSVELKI